MNKLGNFILGLSCFFTVFVEPVFSSESKMVNAVLISYLGESDHLTLPILISGRKWKREELEYKFGKFYAGLLTQMEANTNLLDLLKNEIKKKYKKKYLNVFGNVLEFRLIYCSSEGDYLPLDYERAKCEQTLYVDHEYIYFLIDFFKKHSADLKSNHPIEDTLKELESIKGKK